MALIIFKKNRPKKDYLYQIMENNMKKTDKNTISIEAFIKGKCVKSYTNFEDKYDEQTIEEWKDFVTSIEALIENNGEIINVYHNSYHDSLSTSIDFYLVAGEIKQNETLNLRVSDQPQTSNLSITKRKLVQELNSNERFLSITINKENNFSFYIDALNYLKKLMEQQKAFMNESFETNMR